MIDVQFAAVERADLIVSFTDPVPGRAVREMAQPPGVLLAGLWRRTCQSAGARSYRTAITGLPAQPVHRLIDAELHVLAPPADGLMQSRRLADRLPLHTGDRVVAEVLEGRRPHVGMTVVGLLDELLGIGAYADIDTVNPLMGKSGAVNSVGVAVAGDTGTLRRLLKDRPEVATITERAVSLRQFRQTTQMFVLVMAGILSVFSVMITIGVVYNHARIALQERAWELASLRVLGFTRAEVAGPLLSELSLAAADRGASGLWFGHRLVHGMSARHENEIFTIPAVIRPRSYALAGAVVLLAGAARALIVRRHVDRLDLVSVLKTRE